MCAPVHATGASTTMVRTRSRRHVSPEPAQTVPDAMVSKTKGDDDGNDENEYDDEVSRGGCVDMC